MIVRRGGNPVPRTGAVSLGRALGTARLTARVNAIMAASPDRAPHAQSRLRHLQLGWSPPFVEGC